MKISKTARREGKALFQACRANGVLDENRVRSAVSAVIAGKPRGYLGTLEHFLRLVKLDVHRRTARVENAVESPSAMMQSITTALEQRYGPGLNLTFWINPELLGGLRIQVGSDIFDSSVTSRLNALAESF